MYWIAVLHSTAATMEQLCFTNEDCVRNDEFISGSILNKKTTTQIRTNPKIVVLDNEMMRLWYNRCRKRHLEIFKKSRGILVKTFGAQKTCSDHIWAS